MAIVEISQYIAALEHAGITLAEAADRSGLDAYVRTCPGWQVRDLLKHTGYVHRWAADYVAQERSEMIAESPEDQILASGPDGSALLTWFREGHTALVKTLQAADPRLSCWTFLPAPSPLAFWARRQAHETTIHRIDAELAAGRANPVPALLAADGVDELLLGFAARRRPKADTEPRRGLQIHATDTGDYWLAEISRGGVLVRRGPAESPACSVAGPASGLYPLLWNRCDVAEAAATVRGDAKVLAEWRTRIRVRWS